MRAIDLVDNDEMPLEEKVYHLRLGGLSIPEIAGRLGISKVRCATLYKDYLTELSKLAELEDTDARLMVEKDRLDTLMQAYWHSATEPHEAMVTVGKGADAYMEKMEVDPSLDAAKFVLAVMAQRAKLEGFDQLNPVDTQTVHQVLVVGNDTAAFLAALASGRDEHKELASGDPDNEIEGRVEEEV